MDLSGANAQNDTPVRKQLKVRRHVRKLLVRHAASRADDSRARPSGDIQAVIAKAVDIDLIRQRALREASVHLHILVDGPGRTIVRVRDNLTHPPGGVGGVRVCRDGKKIRVKGWRSGVQIKVCGPHHIRIDDQRCILIHQARNRVAHLTGLLSSNHRRCHSDLFSIYHLINLRHFQREILEAQIQRRRAIRRVGDAILPGEIHRDFRVVRSAGHKPVELQRRALRRIETQVHPVIDIPYREFLENTRRQNRPVLVLI